MTKDDLEELKWLKVEVERTKKEYLNAKPVYAADSVFGSTEYNPENRVISVRGYTYHDIDRKLKRYERAIKDLDDKIDQLEDWLESIPDSFTRQIMQLKYRNGLTNEQIAEELGFNEKTIRRKIKTFLRNVL